MSAILLFMAGIAIIAGWWLSRQRLTAKPWLEEGAVGEFPGGSSLSLPPAKIGLGIFLAVVGSLFALFFSAYTARMALIDWRPLPIPALLWFNSIVLILSSVALQWALVSMRRGDNDSVLAGLLAAEIGTVVFLLGQIWAWRELLAAGYYLNANPANTFFYLITALHGLHLLGGLVVLNRTAARAWSGVEPKQLRLSVELCAMYWHFLALVWLIMLALLTGWADDFVDICRQLLG